MIVLLILFVSQVQREGLKGEQVCRMGLSILGIQAVAEERPQLWGLGPGICPVDFHLGIKCLHALGAFWEISSCQQRAMGGGVPDQVERNIVINACCLSSQGAPGPRGHQGLPGPPGAPVSHYSLMVGIPNTYGSGNV